ncbi:MAG: hypothetical protein GMKNLPBB_01733 [Myxococcota bacterium]|nr:hypothetical protein [Myxococcota bacterium]
MLDTLIQHLTSFINKGGWALWSPLTIACWAVMLVVLERLYPHTPGQKLFRVGFWDDFFWYTLVQSAVLGWIIGAFIEWIDALPGVSRLAAVSGWPLWTQVLFFLFIHDFYIYAFHRLQHYNKYLWRVHEAHHSVRDVDWVAGSRSHPLEILINQTVEFAPIVLLGAHPDVAVIKGLVSACWGMFIHCNVDVRLGALQYVINGPEMHRWHHAADVAPPGFNFATKFAFWDWIFGTAYMPVDRKPAEYGLMSKNDFREGYFWQIWAAFRPWKKPWDSGPWRPAGVTRRIGETASGAAARANPAG